MAALVISAPIAIHPPEYSRQSGSGINPFIWKISDSKIYQVLVDGLAVRVVLSADGGLTWPEQDSGNSPDVTGVQTCSSFLNESTGIIYILERIAGTGVYRIDSFDTNTNLWGASSADYTGTTAQFTALYQRSDGTLVVLGFFAPGTKTLRYIELPSIGGSWGAATALVVLPNNFNTVLGVVVDSSDRGHVVYGDGSGSLAYALISSGMVLGTPVEIASSLFFDFVATDQRIWDNKIVIAYTGYLAGPNPGELHVSIGDPLSGAAFTDYTVGSVPTTGTLTYPTLAEDRNGNLVVFGAWTDYSGSPIIDQLLMWTFDGGSSWGTEILFYDAVANPPTDSVPDIDQFIHTGGAVQLSNGAWVYSTALEILPSICGGFALVTPAPFNPCVAKKSLLTPPPGTPGGGGSMDCSVTGPYRSLFGVDAASLPPPPIPPPTPPADDTPQPPEPPAEPPPVP